jgi:predicted Zn-dependent peptidase
MHPAFHIFRFSFRVPCTSLGLAACLLTTGTGGATAQTATPASVSNAIPARPEKLVFPPLKYEPPAPEEFRVVLASGPVAYVASDRELPLVNIVVQVRTGDYLEPAGREGLAGLTGYLLARGGTQSKSAEELEERLAFLAAHLESNVGNTMGTVSLNLLSKDLDEGLAILREVLTAPRFQEDKLALRKQQILQDMKQRNDESSGIEGRERDFLAFGERFWKNQLPVAASIEAITRDDLVRFHKTWFHPSNFILAVSGDFDRESMLKKLDALFASWPFTGSVGPAIPTNTTPAAPGMYLSEKDVNQGRVSVLLPGMMRDDPDFLAAIVMNDILGGGGFSSRIMSRVRSDEGLAYSAGSRFQGGVYYPLPLIAGFQTKSRTVIYATSIVLGEMKRMAAEPVTDEELNTSKRGFIDRFPRSFAARAQVVDTFAMDEFTGRYAKNPAFWKQFRDKIAAVTREDVQRVAKRLLHPEQAVILVVGREDEVLKGHPDHPMTLESLTGGKLTRLPERDPMTLKPVAK